MGLQKFIKRVSGLAGGRNGVQEVSLPVLTDPVRFPYGAFKFKVQAPKKLPCTIQASTDFSHWTALGPESVFAENHEYIDSDAPKFSCRFYRVISKGIASTTALGFVSMTLPPGFSLIANPFQRGNNSVGDAFKGWKQGTTLNKFDTLLVRLSENAMKNERWTNPDQQLLPGEGAIFFNPTEDYRIHSFAGEVAQGSFTMPIPSGFSLRSSLVPLGGNLLDDLQFPIADGDVVHLFDRDRQTYTLHPFENGKWSSGPPIVSVGEAFWVAKAEPGNWTKQLEFGGPEIAGAQGLHST